MIEYCKLIYSYNPFSEGHKTLLFFLLAEISLPYRLSNDIRAFYLSVFVDIIYLILHAHSLAFSLPLQSIKIVLNLIFHNTNNLTLLNVIFSKSQMNSYFSYFTL